MEKGGRREELLKTSRKTRKTWELQTKQKVVNHSCGLSITLYLLHLIHNLHLAQYFEFHLQLLFSFSLVLNSQRCNLREPKASEALKTCNSVSGMSNPCCVGWSRLAWMCLNFVCMVKTSPSPSLGCFMQSLIKHYDKVLCRYEVLLKCRVIH